MLQPKLTEVIPLENYRLKLTYETGEVKLFDVTPYIKGSWFGELTDKDYFCTVHLSRSKERAEFTVKQNGGIAVCAF